MFYDAKIHPVLDSCELITGTMVRIYNMNDDMHGVKGIYKGDYPDTDGVMKSLIVLKDENDREFNFYTLPDTIRIIK